MSANPQKKYKAIRDAAGQIVTSEFCKIEPSLTGHLRITDIDGVALRYLRNAWKPHPEKSKNVGGPDEWKYFVQQYRVSYSSRVEAAIWYDNHLCALLLGKCSRNKYIARISYLQGNFDDTYLKGLRTHIATRFLEVFAAANKIQWVGIQAPYHGAVPLYTLRGYVLQDPFDHRNDALCKKLT
ncbi:hypothetical protein K6U58_17970 [Vibrio fluvialis]|uniref:hypothetical protein n=1 Tax=Vibrio fluvialis TaxID=676 RepID=UPI001EEC8F3A|nr:hypothetical protein [Vibrio fluvialis]MCG6360452.1 hypothetical protein [Vibrio fluvialis]